MLSRLRQAKRPRQQGKCGDVKTTTTTTRTRTWTWRIYSSGWGLVLVALVGSTNLWLLVVVPPTPLQQQQQQHRQQQRQQQLQQPQSSPFDIDNNTKDATATILHPRLPPHHNPPQFHSFKSTNDSDSSLLLLTLSNDYQGRRNDVYAAAWWQSMHRFNHMMEWIVTNTTRRAQLVKLEAACHLAVEYNYHNNQPQDGNNNTSNGDDVRLTVDWMTLSVEHLSKWWKSV
eukprot:scaffold39697_cov191-Amphora_coffeaeformis.AAC.1